MPTTFTYTYMVTSTAPDTYEIADTSLDRQVNPTDLGQIEIDRCQGDKFTSDGQVGISLGAVTTSSQTGSLPGFIVQIDGSYYFVTNQALSDNVPPGQASRFTFVGGSNNAICFMAGTMVATPQGERPIETLGAGDEILSADGRTMTVNWVGRQTVSRVFADPVMVLPVRVRAGALGESLPVRDLLVSPEHALLVDGILVQAGALVNGVSIVREANVPDTFVYYHVETAEHCLLLAEGAPAETFVDNVDRRRFDNWDERAQLPYGDRIVEMDIPRAKSARQVPPATLARLEAIAGISVVKAA